MTETHQDFQIYKGEAKTIRDTVLDENGGLVPLGSCTMIYRMGRSARATAWLIEKTFPGDIEVVSPGIMTVPITHADTVELAAGDYYHEVRVYDAFGHEIVVTTGAFKLLESLTNSA